MLSVFPAHLPQIGEGDHARLVFNGTIHGNRRDSHWESLLKQSNISKVIINSIICPSHASEFKDNGESESDDNES